MEFKYYEVTVNFGWIGTEETYTVYASSKEDAEKEAMEEAITNLTVEEIVEVE